MTDNDKLMMNNTIDKVLKASLGEASNTIDVKFKKTVLIKDYETEVLEASTQVTFDHEITGAERIFVSAILRIQMEYEAYCNLVMKGMVTQTQFDQRKLALAQDLNAIKAKAEALIGKSLDNYLELKP